MSWALVRGRGRGISGKALDSNKPIPTELRGEDRKLRKDRKLKSEGSVERCVCVVLQHVAAWQVLDLADDRTKEQRKAMDDEYAYMGVKDPKVQGSL